MIKTVKQRISRLCRNVPPNWCNYLIGTKVAGKAITVDCSLQSTIALHVEMTICNSQTTLKLKPNVTNSLTDLLY